MKGFLIALQFLTSMPVRIKGEIADEELARSMVYFPLVGFVIGLMLAISYKILDLFFMHQVNCALILMLNVLLTGGLHIDGFIDTFDGIASRSDRKRILEIMREGRPGAIGIVAAILLFLLKYSLLTSLTRGMIGAGLIAMATLGRWSLILASGLYPYAREGEGVGAKFIHRLGRREGFLSSIFASLVVIYIFKFKALILMPAIATLFMGFNFYLNKRIGGITGDTLGALNEMVEVLTLALMVILF